MSDNECKCYCGRRWGLCKDSMACLRELRENAEDRQVADDWRYWQHIDNQIDMARGK